MDVKKHLNDVHIKNPYLFLEQQLVDCTADHDTCPSCQAAIKERLDAGLINKKKVNQIIANFKKSK